MSKWPWESNTSMVTPVEEASLKASTLPAAFCNENMDKGVVVPRPKKAETVVVPVTLRVLPPLKVKLVEVPMVVLPWPNNTSLLAKVTKAMLGEVPPVEVMEPLAVTDNTGVEVVIILPLGSTAMKAELAPET
jgi:hypothetical protein